MVFSEVATAIRAQEREVDGSLDLSTVLYVAKVAERRWDVAFITDVLGKLLWVDNLELGTTFLVLGMGSGHAGLASIFSTFFTLARLAFLV